MERIIFHIDVNSAFLSWSAISRLEAGDTVDLREIPSIIGGDRQKRHGVVLAKSTPAKAYGIQTGEPIVNALKKCPTLTLAAPDHKLYRKRSEQLMDYLSSLCPEIEQVSIDECYLNFTPIAHLYSSPEEAAREIKDAIHKQFHFTVNVGISDRKVLAKMASDFQKPNRVHTLYSYEIQDKMWPLTVDNLFMCGRSSVEALRKLEILTIGDLAKADPAILTAHLKSHGKTLWEFANGIDDSKVETTSAPAKGIGNSTTVSQDIEDGKEACRVLMELSESVGARLRKSRQLAGMVSCEIKYHTFRSVSHQTTLLSPTDSTTLIYEAACRLFEELWDGTPIRLLGVRTSKLSDHSMPIQMNLFEMNFPKATQTDTPVSPAAVKTNNYTKKQKQEKLDVALDKIKNKYGKDAVVRGSLMPGTVTKHKHNGQEE